MIECLSMQMKYKDVEVKTGTMFLYSQLWSSTRYFAEATSDSTCPTPQSASISIVHTQAEDSMTLPPPDVFPAHSPSHGPVHQS